MTNDELRELDREIAVKVFGVVPRDVRAKGSTNTVRVFTNSRSAEDGVWDERELRTLFGVLFYSSNMAAAWRVVDRMRELGWFVSLDAVFETPEYEVEFWKPGRTDFGCCDPSAPVAICRAALEAVKQSEG